MAAGDLASTLAGFVPALSSDDLRLGFGKIDEAADLALRFGQLRFGTSTALLASTGQGVGQRAVDTSSSDEYRWNGTAWQLWGTAWKSWTPTSLSGLTVGNGTWSAGFRYLDGSVMCNAIFTLGSTSGWTGQPLILSPPVTASSANQHVSAGSFLLGASMYPAHIYWPNTSQVRIRPHVVSGSSVVTSDVTATVPGTWAAGHTFEFRSIFRAY